MPRKKKESLTTIDLGTTRGPAPGSPGFDLGRAIPSGLIEYSLPDGERWRVNQWTLLAAEFDLVPEAIQMFHRVLSADARRWIVVRRLFGIMPVRVSMSADPEDLRTWSRDELCGLMGLTRAQLQAEVDAARGLWQSQAREPAPEPTPPPALQSQAPLTDGELLGRYRFPASLFEVRERSPSENHDERGWFVDRVREWQSLLDHQKASGLVRAALLNELHLRRAESALASKPFGSREYKGTLSTRQQIEAEYRQQLSDIDAIAPWVGAAKNQLGLRPVISTLVTGIQEYYADGTQTLIDGMHTAAEVQVLLRRSVQQPDPRYRASVVVNVAAARAGLWDPHYKCHIPPAQFKALDEAWKTAANSVLDQQGARVPDLESDDPVAGEYEALQIPEPGAG